MLHLNFESVVVEPVCFSPGLNNINSFLLLGYFLSPILKANCRYLPSCSEYSIIAFKKYGLVKGFYYSLKRILKCHPFGGSGYDPVPKKIDKEI